MIDMDGLDIELIKRNVIIVFVSIFGLCVEELIAFSEDDSSVRIGHVSVLFLKCLAALVDCHHRGQVVRLF